MSTQWIQTVNGAVKVQDLGLVLPHEHLFTDLRGPTAPGYADADPKAVARLMGSYLAAAQRVGVTALVECSTVGVGRNIAILKHLAETTSIHLVAPTGLYRDAFIPPPLREVNTEQLAAEWVREITEGIGDSKVRTGFIKVAVSDDGLTPLEIRNLRAAALASQRTGAAVASHTPSGDLALQQMAILEGAGIDLNRFIWAHANLESRKGQHAEAARRGVYLEFDGVGAEWQSQAQMLDLVIALIDAGHSRRILLSHDAGWYDPSQADGRPEPQGVRGYTALVEQFLPALRARGVTDDVIKQITHHNPAQAFALGNNQRGAE